MADILVAYEEENPFNVFMYRLMDFDVNTFETQLLEDKIAPDKRYIFTLNHETLVNLIEKSHIYNEKLTETIKQGGKSAFYHFLVEPLQIDKYTRSALFLIKDNRIELRRFPRIYLNEPLIEVDLDELKGFVKNISLGGARIKLSGNLTGEMIEELLKREKITANFKLAGTGTAHRLIVKPLAFDIFQGEISLKFENPDLDTVKFYTELQKILKNLKTLK